MALVVAALGTSGGAVEADKSDFNDAGAGAVDSDVAAGAGTGAGESSVEAGVAAEASVGDAELGEEGLGEAGRGPRSSEANADGPKNANKKIANNMAHLMASLTQSPCTRARGVVSKNPARKSGSND